MALTPGTRFGAYDILTQIGVGGMGEVYQAKDTRLKRDVALKVLPDSFAQDVERLARFQREAELLATLNHPNIAGIYELEESNGLRALVLELVEGPTLADRIAKGAIPLDEALPIVRQIADALEAAHERGIIHRDLKPANIKARNDGTVKVLDFGLAKAMDYTSSPSLDLSNSPTITSPAMMTSVGVLLGTAAYMSPEQAKGRPADKRSDLWAFGCVLYEMLAGKRAFDGENVNDTLAAVLRGEPDWAALPVNLPAGIRTLLRRCLVKDRKRRLSDIADARIEIDEALTGPVETQPADDARQRDRTRVVQWVAAVSLLGMVISLGLVAFLLYRSRPNEARSMRFAVSPPDGWSLEIRSSGGASPQPLAVSPDGRRIALVARNASGVDRLWIRSLDTLMSQELAGTDGALSPFWSPDSRFVGFFAGRKLKKVDVSGAPPITICDAPEFRGGTWNQYDLILFATTGSGGLQKVSASSGAPMQATTLMSGDGAHWRPSFLPDGRHFLFRVANGGIYIGSLDSPERTKVVDNPGASNSFFAQGYVLFLRERTLMALPLDQKRLVPIGEAIPIADQIQTVSNPGSAVFSVSSSGVLAYQTGTSGAYPDHLVWSDREGQQSKVLDDPSLYGNIDCHQMELAQL